MDDKTPSTPVTYWWYSGTQRPWYSPGRPAMAHWTEEGHTEFDVAQERTRLGPARRVATRHVLYRSRVLDFQPEWRDD